MREAITARLGVALIGAVLAVGVAACGSSSSSDGDTGAAGAAGATGATAVEAPATQPSSGSGSGELNDLLPPAIRKAGVLKLATDAAYPPCEWMPSPESNEIIGFEPDLWNAMGDKLGVKVQATSINFDGLIPGVQSGRYDIAMECISDTAERQQQVTFVDFMFAELAILALETNSEITADPLTLCGRKAATQRGTTFGELVDDVLSPYCTKRGKPAIQNLQYPAQGQVLLALYSGRAEFAINDVAASTYLQEKAPKPIKLITNDLTPKQYIGMVVPKDDRQLQKAMLASLEAIHADGTYDKILDKWKLHELALEEPGLNLATARPIPIPKP